MVVVRSEYHRHDINLIGGVDGHETLMTRHTPYDRADAAHLSQDGVVYIYDVAAAVDADARAGSKASKDVYNGRGVDRELNDPSVAAVKEDEQVVVIINSDAGMIVERE